MALTINDLKLLESENMTNFNNGGGAMSNNVIIDGASNNIMPDVTEQSRAYGNVEERKAFVGTRSQNNDPLFAAMCYVSKLPTDTQINVNLAKSNLWFDERNNREFKKKPQAVKLNQQFRLDNFLLAELAATKYGLVQQKAMNCVIVGTATTGTKTITVAGIDGIITGSYLYGVNGLKTILLNSFIIESTAHSEEIIVKNVEITSYTDASTDTETNPYWASNYNAGDNNSSLYRPLKKYTATLTLTYNLANTYVGADAVDYTTWFGNNPKLYTTKNELESKFYTAKKTAAIVSESATRIPITSNTNQIIPLIAGVTLDDATLGVNTAAFTTDGNYDAFATGDVIIILNDAQQSFVYTSGQVVTLPRTNLSRVTIRDSANNLVDSSRFTVDLNLGKVTIVDVSGLSQPLTITDRVEDLGLIIAISGNSLTLKNPITHAYPAGSIVANCMLHGTLQAIASRPFDQQIWSNVWQDTTNGSTVSAQYNATDYPISVTNYSAIEERWAIIFNTATTFNLIGEHLGTIMYNGSTSTDLAPINPNTAHPYFVLPAAGLGGGWSAGNVIRFNTYASAAPFWVLRSIAQGVATSTDFDFAIECRGEIDAA